jgi:peptidoglycan/LPS O-acetylase OafA/YrhL
MSTTTRSVGESVGSYLKAGLIAGVIAAVVANIYFLVYTQVSGNTFEELNLVSVTLASIVPGLAAGLLLYGLRRWSARGTQIFVIGGAVFALLTIVPNIVAPPHPNFFWASSPLHVIVAAVILAVLPRMVRSSR